MWAHQTFSERLRRRGNRAWTSQPSPRLLEPEVLERRRVRKAWNQAHAGLRDAWTYPGERAKLVQRRVQGAFVQDALDLMQQRLTLGAIDFPGLALEQVLDLG